MDALFPYISLLGAAACVILGVFVLSRNLRSIANIAFALGMTAFAVMEFGKFLSAYFSSETSVLPIDKLRLTGELILPVAWLIFSAHPMQSASARAARAQRIGIMVVSLISALFFSTLVFGVSLPAGVARETWRYWLSVYMILSMTAVVANFEVTLRSADHPRRWKLKYLFLGIGSILAVRIFIHSQRLLFPAAPPAYPEIASTVVLIGCAFIAFSLIRHQLLDVNVFVSRYFAYNSFTVAAVGIYLLVVGLTAQVIRGFGGSFFEYWGVLFVLSSILLLIAALLSTTVRKKAQIFINRSFYRNRYDYHKEWLSLTDRLSSKLDVREIYLPVRNLFSETLWVQNIRLWLCDDDENDLRVVRLPGEVERGEETTKWDPRLLYLLKERGYPATLEDLVEALPADAFGQTREVMEAQGVSVLVPLVTGEVLVGILGCAKSRSGYSMDREDFDLMNTVARQAANNFLIARLSQSLIRAKEMEAFHAFSAFVLHDLKNFVSMLSLVVQNADRNLDNPEFRKDALRSISQTVEKMKRMMERLAALSREPDLHRETVDLDGLVREVVAEMNGSVGSTLAEDLRGPLPIVADPVQIRKILTNLILNADEAMARDGEVRLATFSRDGKSVISVSDSGCGMTPEFIAQSLFKPFATTKSQGFGIGLYQVKRIVEAHEGLIEVESAVGTGTTVRVLLPQAGG